MTKRLRDFLVVAAVALSAWELLVRATGVPPYILPGPLLVASAAVEYAELIGEHTLLPWQRSLSGCCSALFLASVLRFSWWCRVMLVGCCWH